MKKKFPIFSFVKTCPLFEGISEADLELLLACLSSRRRNYSKGNFIFSAGQRPGEVGVILTGSAHILKEDFRGNRNLLAEIRAGDLFAEGIVCAGVEKFPVSVVAQEDTDALLLDYRRIITSCRSACVFHRRLIENMLRVLARKNMLLVDKMEHITKRTTREKLLSYLARQAELNGTLEFDIPFDRRMLADYLSVDRSALSDELSKMRNAGLIAFRKNHFALSEGKKAEDGD
jgi:CRP-like cAMP-binding protein